MHGVNEASKHSNSLSFPCGPLRQHAVGLKLNLLKFFFEFDLEKFFFY